MTLLLASVLTTRHLEQQQQSEATNKTNLTIMNVVTALIVLSLATTEAFVVHSSGSSIAPPLFGYLDDLSSELYSPDGNPDLEADSKEATDMAKDKIDRFGPGDFSQFKVCMLVKPTALLLTTLFVSSTSS